MSFLPTLLLLSVLMICAGGGVYLYFESKKA